MLSASWDGKVRLYDDNTTEEEGSIKYTMDKHKDSVNYLDFRLSDNLCASCGDDGLIFIFNFISMRQEGVLKHINPNHNEPAAVKSLKFLDGSDILISADLDGFVSFWCVSTLQHQKKNQLIC